ncbi:helix-turn-helix domain-containing protein [Pseudomonas sp. HLT2-19-2]
MARKTAPLLPRIARLLTDLGERLKLARLRRRLTAKQVAERAGMSVMTLRSLESGGAGVTMGAYLSVMHVLGLEQDLNKLGALDQVGHHLQDGRLTRARPPRTKKFGNEQSAAAAKAKKPSGVHATSVDMSHLSASTTHDFPLNTHSLSALLVSKKKLGLNPLK